MSEIRQLFKLLLNHEFYQKHKDKIPLHSFDEIGQDLITTVKLAHEKFTRNLTVEELYLLHNAENPTLTTANKNTVEVYLSNVKDEPDVSTEIAEVVYSSLWRKEVGRYIAQYGIRLGDGDYIGVDDLANYIKGIESNFIPSDSFAEPVNTDPLVLFEALKQKGRWDLNIPSLKQKIGKLSEGNFIIVLARPEAGKSACVIHLMAAIDGFAAQGAKVLYVGNEESADVTAGRSICCFNEVSFSDVQSNPAIAKTDTWEITRQNLIFIHKPEITMGQLDAYCKKVKPDVVVVDQLDHLITSDTYARGDERLGSIYRRARELASKHKCVFIGVSQASAEAEGKSVVTFSQAEGSRTSKAAAADVVLGIGKINEDGGEEMDVVTRYIMVSKNKISGWHGKVVCKLIQSQSRLMP